MSLAACSATDSGEVLGTTVQAQTNEDALADAYELFEQRFETDNQHQVFRMGLSPAEALTEPGISVQGVVTLVFAQEIVSATLSGLDPSEQVSLWMYKNVAGAGRDAGPEDGDDLVWLGDFVDDGNGGKILNANIGASVRFDFDALALARTGESPTESILAVAFRTLFEKRYFRGKFGLPNPVVPGVEGTNASSLDPLVQIGADVFFNETFDGNGRTCGTCHRAENNMVLDPAFIATLPHTDPLFVAETNPALAGLEDNDLLRGKALIKENVDGFDDLDNKFTMRAVQHTFGLADSVPRDTSLMPDHPPDEMTGWGGDGAPGRGTLLEFTLGAVNQHFPARLDRVPGVDFRIPTQLELDALEAFQLFSGRQTQPDVTPIVFADAQVERGKQLFNTQGLCFACHNDAGSNVGNFENISVDTGVEERPERGQLGLPADGGLGREPNGEGSFGDGTFNIQPLIEAADTAPFFHNNTATTLEDAISHYVSPAFKNSPVVADNPALGEITLDSSEISDVAAFLRVLNVAENIRQVRQRVAFVRDNRGSGNDSILDIAIADVEDALEVLGQQSLHSDAQHDLQTIRQTLLIARANADAARPAYLEHALVWIGLAKGRLFAQNPNDEF